MEASATGGTRDGMRGRATRPIESAGSAYDAEEGGKISRYIQYPADANWLVDWLWAAGRANVQRLKWKVPFGIGGALVGPCLELQLYLAMVMGASAQS